MYHSITCIPATAGATLGVVVGVVIKGAFGVVNGTMHRLTLAS